ncbi:unnamed protein product [Brugia pahangi]|uniref:NADH-ubiquinone oxidoreductase subunit B14.5a n=1 Tax=Brugia pahangi TaxID=6280 RepID=A0A0N4TX94_BRUPA|nr:unnamed protein product [Brugia pahangi]
MNELHPDNLNDHSKQLRKELKVPQTEPYTRIYGKQLETERGTYSSLKDNTGKMAFAPVVATTSSCHLDLRSHTEPQRWNFMSSTGQPASSHGQLVAVCFSSPSSIQ